MLSIKQSRTVLILYIFLDFFDVNLKCALHRINVTCISEDFQGFMYGNLSIKVIGNDILEEKMKEAVLKEIVGNPKIFIKIRLFNGAAFWVM